MSGMWNAISDFGTAAVTLLLAAGVALAETTKILYAGCGVEVDENGFRILSGHTMLLSAVWMICIALFLRCADLACIGVTISLASGALMWCRSCV